MFKRIILFILSASILINTFSVDVYAETEETTQPVISEDTTNAVDVLKITEDTYITEDTEYSGEINIAE